MEEKYPVYMGEAPVGQVCLKKQGLYLKLECVCQSITDRRLHLWLEDLDLGLMVPQNGQLRLVKHMPAKQLQGRAMDYVLKEPRAENTFIPITEDAPLPDLQLLENGKLGFQGDDCGIVVLESSEEEKM